MKIPSGLRHGLLFAAGFIVTFPYATLAQSSSSAPAEEINAGLTLSGKPLSLKEAALIAYKNSPEIMQAGLNIDMARAGYRIAGGGFAFTTGATANTGKNRPPSFMGQDGDSQGFTASLTKRFRTGISSSLSAGVTRQDTRGGVSPMNATSNASSANLNVTIPLLQGSGRVSAAAGETSARLASEASELNYLHTSSQILQTTVNAYWAYKAAIERLKIRQGSWELVQKWLSDVKAGLQRQQDESTKKKYRMQISRLNGALADRRQNAIAANENVNTAKGALAIAMGIPAEQVASLGEPSEGFSTDWKETLAKLEQRPMSAKWVALALEKRHDLQATKLTQEASATQLAKARKDTLPRLNLGLNYGYNARELGNGFNHYVGSFTNDMRGANAGATLTFSYPLGNDVAEGSRDRANATHRVNVIGTNNLARTIAVQVDTTAGVVMSRLKQSVETRKAIDYYSPAIKQIQPTLKRLGENPSKVFNVLDLEEKATEAVLAFIDSLEKFSNAIVELRFQTGTILVPDEENENTLTLGNMAELPAM